MDCSPPGTSAHRDYPGQNTGKCCNALLQGIFPAQGLNPGLPHCGQIPYCLSNQGNPRILEGVAYSFCMGSSRLRNQTGVSGIASGFFSRWHHCLVTKPKSFSFFLSLSRDETQIHIGYGSKHNWWKQTQSMWGTNTAQRLRHKVSSFQCRFLTHQLCGHGQTTHLSEPQFCHMWTGGNDSPCFMGSWVQTGISQV